MQTIINEKKRPIKNGIKSWISRYACVSPSTLMGPGCCIFAYAVIYKNVILGKGIQVGRWAEILPGSRVPDGAIIAECAKIGPNYDWNLHTKWNLDAVTVN